MKTLTTHITEALKIGKNISKFSTYSCQPKTKDELLEIIFYRKKEKGPNCDLNDIDVSLIEDMSFLFYYSDFIGDISRWDTSNVNDMSRMFYDSKFTGDISNWNTKNVNNMKEMFAFSKFDGDINKWDISNVTDMSYMFIGSEFNQDISNWKINKDCKTIAMLRDCSIKNEFKPKSLQK